MTRDEFLVRDFLTDWLYRQYLAGAYLLQPSDVVAYLRSLIGKKGILWSGAWSESTTDRVASGLLRIAADFGLLTSGPVKELPLYPLRNRAI